jgi:hypothetical protein
VEEYDGTVIRSGHGTEWPLMSYADRIDDLYIKHEYRLRKAQSQTHLRIALNLTTRRPGIRQEGRTESFPSIPNSDDPFTFTIPGEIIDSSTERSDSQLQDLIRACDIPYSDWYLHRSISM